jgi:hypothetical protein
MIVSKPQQTNIKTWSIKIDNFRGGSNTLINPGRLKPIFSPDIRNLYQVQDGIWKTRPGRAYYGQPIPGAANIDGATEFDNGGTREIIAIASDGYAYKSTDGGNWTKISNTITFTPGKKYYFAQIGGKLFIGNSCERLTVYDGNTLTRYNPLPDPTSAPTGTRVGLTSGAYNNYYRIVAINRIGNTNPSPSVNVTTNKHRDNWDTSNYVALSWTAIPGANGYLIYWGQFNEEEVLIAETTNTNFNDYGNVTYPANIYVETPDDNTTGGPKLGSLEISQNRLWGTGDPDNEYRVYATGTGQYFTNPAFSPFYGGVWIDLELGGKNKPVAVAHYRTGKGDPIITVLCRSADGNGTIFQVDLTTVTIGDETAVVPAAYKLVGAVGADGAKSVVKVLDNIFFANKKGIFALRNKQQMFNVLSNDDMTAPIRNQYENIPSQYVENIVGYYNPPRIYFSIPTGSNEYKIAIFDMERNNWTWYWDFGAKDFFEYTDSSGVTHFLIVPPTGNRLVELSESYTSDFGSYFYQLYTSPLIPIDKDYRVIAKIKEVILELGSFRGGLTIEVVGVTKNGQILTLASATVSSTLGTSGWGDDFFSDTLFSDTNDTPSVFVADVIKKYLKVNKKLYALQIKIYSTTANTVFELLGLQAWGFAMLKRSPSSWKIN